MLTALWIPDGVNFLITCRRADFLGGQIERAFDRVREVLGIEVTEEARYEGATRVREFYRALSELLKQFVEKETGVPVLSLETDLADSRSYSAEAMRTRVETFAEMLRARKR
jgi:benzoyl-CoA reductase/2-hydroxyglutaryl-CoA dehydratase subunit BcrC/BadD/HgdB